MLPALLRSQQRDPIRKTIPASGESLPVTIAADGFTARVLESVSTEVDVNLGDIPLSR